MITNRREYGLTGDVSLEFDARLGFVILGGVVLDGSGKHLSAVLTKRAAYLLWAKLTNALYPDDSPTGFTPKGGTGQLRTPDGQLLTTQIAVQPLANGFFEIIGQVMQAEWLIRISQTEARHLWGALDVLLFPLDWEGREGYTSDNQAAKQGS